MVSSVPSPSNFGTFGKKIDILPSGPTSVSCLANLSNFNADINVTVDNTHTAIMFDEMDKTMNEEGLFTFFRANITNPNDPHSIMLQRSRNPSTVTQTWNLVVVE